MSKDDENELETSLASYSSKEALDEEDIQQRNVQHNITVKDALRRFLDLEGEVRKAMSKSSTERIEKSKRAVHDLSEEEFAKRLRS